MLKAKIKELERKLNVQQQQRGSPGGGSRRRYHSESVAATEGEADSNREGAGGGSRVVSRTDDMYVCKDSIALPGNPNFA